MDVLRIATRKSPLALWQAEFVAGCLREAHPKLPVELVPMSTRGDKILDVALAKVGGKGLFVKELELALLEGRADIAAHSVKDVPAEFPDGLHMPVLMAREDPRDAFVSNRYESLDALPGGGRVGTCSLRRKSQLRRRRPDLEYLDLRGNVGTRLGRLDRGELDAIILASAGLKRLGIGERIRQSLGPEIVLPAVGQGAIGIECRCGDTPVETLIAALNHADTVRCVNAERSMNSVLGGGCHVPVAGHAELAGDGTLGLRGLVGSLDGIEIVEARAQGAAEDGVTLGRQVAEALLARGGRKILELLQVDG